MAYVLEFEGRSMSPHNKTNRSIPQKTKATSRIFSHDIDYDVRLLTGVAGPATDCCCYQKNRYEKGPLAHEWQCLEEKSWRHEQLMQKEAFLGDLDSSCQARAGGVASFEGICTFEEAR